MAPPHALATLALCSALFAAACTADTRPAPDVETLPRAGPSVIYLDGTTLTRYDLTTEETERLTELPSADAVLSADLRFYAAVRENDPAGPTEEGFRDPYVVLGRVGADEDPVELGPGRAPLFSPDGRLVAAISAAEGYFICDQDAEAEAVEEDPEGEGCITAERVAVYRRTAGANQEAQYALGANTWSLLGWTVDDRVVAISTRRPQVWLGYPGATFEEQLQLEGVEPATVWGVSPRELKLLLVLDEGAGFLEPATEDEPELFSGLDSGLNRFGDGSWSPTGNAIAAVSIEGRAGRAPRTSLVLISVDSGDVERVPDSEGALGQVVWSEQGGGFVYARADPDTPRRLQAVLCSAALDCRELFSWRDGVQLLGLSSL